MTQKHFALLLAGAATIAFSHAAVVAYQADAPRTVWDGVYTEAQVKRAAPLYKEKCAKCHAEELTGKDAPALVGPEFSAAWTDLSLNDMFDRIIKSMPDDEKGTLTRPQTADLIAFILAGADMPAGKAELPTDAAALRLIKYVGTKP